jgi:hypothetical protein
MGNITLTRSMPSLGTFSPPASSFAVYIEGNGHRIDANNAGRVFVFASGRFLIAHLTIADARATGGPGGDSYEGGAAEAGWAPAPRFS